MRRRWSPHRPERAAPGRAQTPLLALIPPTFEALCARWRRRHPEDAHLTDTELEAKFQALSQGRNA